MVEREGINVKKTFKNIFTKLKNVTKKHFYIYGEGTEGMGEEGGSSSFALGRKKKTRRVWSVPYVDRLFVTLDLCMDIGEYDTTFTIRKYSLCVFRSEDSVV